MKGKIGWIGLCLIAGLVILSACAQKPAAELQKAEKSLKEAKDAGAMQLAPSEYKSAENKLNEGKKLIDELKYKDAKNALIEADQLAQIAKQKALSAKQVTKKEEAPKKEAPKKGDATEYKVVKGDCLWNIAGKAGIYGDPYQWPLIYDANKDQIKDANLIYPGQVFKIRKDVSPEEVKQARKKAGAKVK